MSGQRYTPEFEEEAVKQVLQRGYTTADVAARLGVSQHSVYKWVKAATPSSSQLIDDELIEAKKEILRLRGHLKRTEEERDILKKAAVDSVGQPYNHMKILLWGGLLNETYIYNTRKRVCFRFMEARDRV